MSVAVKGLVLNYAVEKKIEPFYTGGPVAATPDAELLFTPCGASVKVVQLRSGEEVGVLDSGTDSEVTCICLTREEDGVVVAYRNLLLKHFSVSDRILQRTWKSGHRAPVLCMVMDEDSGLLATGSADYSVRIWDIVKQFCTHNLKGTSGVVTSVAFCRSFKGRSLLYVGSVEGEICLWDLEESEKRDRCLVRLKPGLGNAVVSLIVKSGELISTDRGQVIRVWDRKTHEELRTISCGEVLEWILPVASFPKAPDLLEEETSKKKKSPSGKSPYFVIGGGEGGCLKMWDVETGRMVWKSEKEQLLGNTAGLAQGILCPAGSGTLCLVTVDQNVLILGADTLTPKSQLVGYNDEILCGCLIGKENPSLVLGTNSADIRLYDRSTLSCRLLRGHSDHVLSVSCSLSHPFFFASSSKDNRIMLWRFSEDSDTPGADCIASATGHTSSVTGVKFSCSDMKFLVSVSRDKTLKLWNLKELDQAGTTATKLTAIVTVVAHEKEITCLDVSPNDKVVATGSMDKMIHLWRIKAGKKMGFQLEESGKISGNKRGVWDICFSPVDQAIASACGDSSVKLFSLVDFSCVKTLEGHDSACLQVRFLPSGQQLITGDSGGLVKLWNIKTSECLKTYDVHEDKVWTLLVSRKGETMVSGGGDGRVLVWKDVTGTEKEEEERKRLETVEKEQKLSNLLKEKNFVSALVMAVKLGKSYNALKVISAMVASNNGQLNSALSDLRTDEVCTLLEYVVEWNTNSRNSHLAQCVLSQILKIYTPEELANFPNISEIVTGLLPYTERHLDRLSRMKQNSSFIDYTWERMKMGGEFQELGLQS